MDPKLMWFCVKRDRDRERETETVYAYYVYFVICYTPHKVDN